MSAPAECLRRDIEAVCLALAGLPRLQRWYVVGAPWGKGDWVVAGNPDPHVGARVCDTEDFDGEQPHALEYAAYIAAANPVVVNRLLQALDAAHAKLRMEQERGAVFERDARRYRWLRERDLDAIESGGLFVGMTPNNLVLNGDDLDDAVDAAVEVKRR